MNNNPCMGSAPENSTIDIIANNATSFFLEVGP